MLLSFTLSLQAPLSILSVQAQELQSKDMYRLYNPNSGEHFYTNDKNERAELSRLGWKNEGIGWYAPEQSNTPVYRLYNENAGDHHYTMDLQEREALIQFGWKDEGIGWYSDDQKQVPLFRQYNPNALAGSHNYTVDANEHSFLVNNGWNDEGIAWYGMKVGSTVNRPNSSGNSSNSNSNSKETSLVTFDLNDGSSETYDWKEVPKGSRVSKPNDPMDEHYQFNGWYLDSNGLKAYDFNSPVNQDLTLYAKWGSDDNSLDGIGEESGTICTISEIGYENGSVYAIVNTNTRAVVAFDFLDQNTNLSSNDKYDDMNPESGFIEEMIELESEQVLASTQVITPEYCELERVSQSISNIPLHFVLKASLYDTDGKSLCAPFYSIQYTEKYIEFENKTINNVSDNNAIILNFDNDSKDNFAVMKNGVILPNQTETTNILIVSINNDEESENYGKEVEYTFVNPDQTVKQLKDGDKVLAADGTGRYSTFIVNGTPTTGQDAQNRTIIKIKPKEFDVSDFYSMIKLDSSGEALNEKAVVVGEEDRQFPEKEVLEKDIIPALKGEGTATVKHAINVEFKGDKDNNNNLDVSFSLGGDITITGTAKFIYDIELFGPDYFETTLKMDKELNLKATFKVSGDNNPSSPKRKEKTFSLPAIIVPLPIPTTVWSVRPEIENKVELSGTITASIKIKDTTGTVYSSKNGKRSLDSRNPPEIKVESQAKCTITIGPKFSTGIEILGKTLTAKISGGAGVEITGTLTNAEDSFTSESPDSKHSCLSCLSIKGKAYAKLGLEIKVSVGKSINITLSKVELEVAAVPLHFGNRYEEMYFSINPGSNSVFDVSNESRIGYGKCPNNGYRIDVKIPNGDDSIPVIFLTNNSQEIPRKLDDPLNRRYLTDGVYTLKAKVGNEILSQMVLVDGGPQLIELSSQNQNGKIEGEIEGIDGSFSTKKASIVAKSNGQTILSTQSDANQKFSLDLPEGLFQIVVTVENCYPFIQYVKVRNGEKTYLPVSLMTKKGSNHGGIAGTITDATNGQSISNATIEIYEGWNNSRYTSCKKRLSTSSNGAYRVNLTNFGIISTGLTPGNYTLVVSKAGYSDLSLDVIVVPDVVTENQNGVMNPVIVSDNLRIVLTWGNSPNDLDSHYVAPLNNGDDHVYYSSKRGQTATLDIDHTSGYGPETITINNLKDLPSGFTYAVHNYSDRGDGESDRLSLSGATVKIYLPNDTQPITYYVPTGRKGTVWNVFKMDNTGRITSLNTFGNEIEEY